MSVSAVLNAEAWRDASMKLGAARSRLQVHLQQDFEATKARIEAEIAHFEAETRRLEEAVGSRVVEFLKEGQPAAHAIKLAAEGATTVAEREAQRLEKEAADAAARAKAAAEAVVPKA